MKATSFIISFILLCLHLQAQQNDTTHTLQTITIFSAKPGAITPVQSLSGKALEKMNSLSVADAARFFSGVQIKDYGGVGGLKTLNVHSMGTNQLGVFYDGIQLSNAQNGTVDLGRFSLDNIEQIELYNAQKSVIFQPAKGFASAAAMYLQSKKPVFQGAETLHGKAGFKTGSFGLINPSLRIEKKLSNNIAAVVSSEWTHADGQYKFRYRYNDYDTTAVRKNGDIDAWRLEAGVYGNGKDSSNWHVQGYYYNSARGLPGPIVKGHFENGQRQWDRNAFIQGGYNQKYGRYSMQLNGKYMLDYVRYLDTTIVTTTGPLMNRFRQHEYYLSSANQYRIKDWWDVALSADFQVNQMTAVNLDRFAIPTRVTTLVAGATQLHVNRIDLQGSVLASIINESTKLYTSGGNRRAYTPTVIASWQPLADPSLRIRAFYKHIFRMPTFNDLYYTTTGNPTLKPEYSRQYDIGASYTKTSTGWWQYFAIQTDAYYSRVTDKIVAVPGKLFRWQMQNIGLVNIYGVDAGVQTSPRLFSAIGTNFSLKYTYQKATDNNDQQIVYVPLHSGSFTTNMSWKAWDMNYSFVYVGARYYGSVNIPEYYIEPWYTHDLSLSWHTRQLKLTGEINNVFNQYYDVIYNYPMPGRYYRMTASVNF
ncbi:TonB-dependent receptor [Chitinophaga sancti]|uniref:TonB-dependent receptor n=1 Tax=Chitinophaga sancti TaxID=1004 RepID=UPI002A76532F|nr:TonB-dependent receptor [Chitinophaga sancti]WPQ60867.1 TonB-dependent receptor [Chitinophaga sancti]